MRLLRQADIEQALPMPQAIRLMGLAFAAISDRSVVWGNIGILHSGS
jgi:hypothetical protein